MSHQTVNTEQLLHDLQVHQVELQQQNEELRQAHMALEESRARYFDLYDLAPVGYLTVADNGLILEANLRAAALLGLPRRELVKRPLSRHIAKAYQDTYYHCRRQLLETGQAQSCELELLQNDGLTQWVKFHVSAISQDNSPPELRVVVTDISERKLLDATLRETNRKLVEATLQANQANQAKSDFLSSMSHELRSPLNAILGFAQLIESGTPAPTQRQQDSLAQIIKGGWYLLSLVNDILDLAAIESGKAVLSIEPVSLDNVLLDCQTMVLPLASSENVQLNFPEPDVTRRVQADPTRLKQILINLLSNAIKYNRPGGTVTVACSVPAPERLRICVQDTGEGLTADKLAQLFQPFNRLGREAGTTKGTGIGLVVSQRLVQSMGGQMGVQSTAGIGSTFWFELNAPPCSG